MRIWDKLTINHPDDYEELPDEFLGKVEEYLLAEANGQNKKAEETDKKVKKSKHAR